MMREPTDAKMTAKAKECLRPILSASHPKKAPPTGLATKPTAKIAIVDRKAGVLSLLSKNWVEMKTAKMA
ncbi:hypothetical protein M3F56_07720 [Cutibacterium avidum]|nr:hypothetical protein [Cutibacterium avidum]MCT1416708.1 hypothetical protein [Cutibacterium avidum]MCX8467452.1 hypothetical protein [Cutibacterium avidum]MCX8469758.1 hypothetical protein [Cutibacterium avidum]MDU5340059.1 hypothetical protein [Cutibacterium avidum]MDU5829963.1 hypothetical protein [Cutibacterium avidum]